MSSLISFLIIVLIYGSLTFMVAVLAYAKGYNEGRGDGYRRARNVHMASTKRVSK
jgi:hypothetical protein